MLCRICGNGIKNTTYKVKEMMYGTGEEFEYSECGVCRCLQISEFPKSIIKYYPKDYYSFSEFNEKKFTGLYGAFKLRKYKSSLNHKGLVNIIFRLLFNEKRYDILRTLSIDKSTRILDVGTGNGEYLYALHLSGYKNVLGIDPYLKHNIEYSSSLRIEKKSIYEINAGWNIITYNHVFEHIENPFKELHQVYKLLNTDGVCIINIPTTSSYVWRKYRTHWYQIDAPRHFYLYSQQSMQILAKDTGFNIESIQYNSIYTQFYYSELNKNSIPMREKPKIKSFAKIPWKIKKIKYNSLSSLLNKRGFGDQCAFILRKV
jgi:predicted SAM-dependent methyltransferase